MQLCSHPRGARGNEPRPSEERASFDHTIRLLGRLAPAVPQACKDDTSQPTLCMKQLTGTWTAQHACIRHRSMRTHGRLVALTLNLGAPYTAT